MVSFGRIAKWFMHSIACMGALPAAAACSLEFVCSPHSEGVFLFFGHCFALLPGLPGMYLRRAFFYMTLAECAAECYIGFGSFFTHRDVIVEAGSYVGDYTTIGCAVLRAGCLIGSNTSLLSGNDLHEWTGEGWSAFDRSRLRRLEIGAGSWIGERAVIMADVGAHAMVAAGAVVSAAVPPAVMVAGNPARFVRRLPRRGETTSPNPASVAESAVIAGGEQ